MKTIQTIFTMALLMISLSLFAQKMNVDTQKSSLQWFGEKVTGKHDGTIQLKEGHITMKDGQITQGEFVIDMTTIANRDVEDAEYKAKLEGHLKSDDFFGVGTYPVSKLEIKEATKFQQNKATVKAHLTIKKTTLPVEFEVEQKDGMMHATIVVDRSKYDVRYGSGSFFEGLGDKMIYDEFTMKVVIALKK